MTFFKRKRETYLANELYVLKTIIISEYYGGSGCMLQGVTVYLLARQKNNVYYELFTDKKIKKKSDRNRGKTIDLTCNVPYIEEVKPIAQYTDKKILKKSLLFDFIMEINVLNVLGFFEEEEEMLEE